jgi:hypothetical protein
MAKDIKVWGGCWQGVERRIVATTSLSKAMDMTGCTRNFICETGNPLEIEVALGGPAVVFGYNTREVKHPKSPDDFKIISDKQRPVHLQLSPGDEKYFKKSGNKVRLIATSGEDEWVVERVEGESKGKQMICHKNSLIAQM